jgi:acyl carrier protein
VDFEEFVRRIGSILEVEIFEPANPYDSLYDDIGLDSFQAYQLLIVIEGLAGCAVPPLDVPELFTLADAFDYYEQLGGSRDGSSP